MASLPFHTVMRLTPSQGNGLTDWDPEVRGHTALIIHAALHYDVATVGNHELYNLTVALDTRETVLPLLGDRYLASNVFITLQNGTEVRFGAPFRRFKTEQGRRVLAFGTLFDFTYAAKGIRIQFMEEFVREKWFLDELKKEEVDVVLLTGHLPVGYHEWTLLHKTVRGILPDVPMCVLDSPF
jgi:2',3'-cyclic-nucleotide 2'-phosphodiesterase (5'-nucleotidase family)